MEGSTFIGAGPLPAEATLVGAIWYNPVRDAMGTGLIKKLTEAELEAVINAIKVTNETME